MKFNCPNSDCPKEPSGSMIVRDGSFFRSSDSRKIQRLRCRKCGKRFSYATFDPAFGQNKRRVNFQLKKLLCASVSQRRAAKILNVHRTTVARKLRYLARLARMSQERYLRSLPKIESLQFDDLETIEHTKCKPLSVTMAVEKHSRKILGFEVSRMPAKGHLAKISRKKYGKRIDQRKEKLAKLMKNLTEIVDSHALFGSDEHPFYPPAVKRQFPRATHRRFKGLRGCIAGQGELKKATWDPLFTLNHTFAMLRANINRLVRKTWCTTKDPARLADHIAIYVDYHNRVLTPPILD